MPKEEEKQLVSDSVSEEGVFDRCVFSAGLVLFSDDPTTEWHLNTHQTKDELLRAVDKVPYRGGNTNTGD